MTQLALLRHARTAWNAEGRIQGHTDTGLSEEGRAQWRGRALPAAVQGMRVVSSPLRRCLETAVLAGVAPAAIEPRLAEMRWGAWEGRRLEDLRRELGDAMRENEARGLDFRPEGGESPRDVLARVTQWMSTLEAPTLAITHRGVIRVVLAAATGWDMLGKPPAKLDWEAVHLFRIEGGLPKVDKLNLK
jgi:broad specificity phosphatase PhoE